MYSKFQLAQKYLHYWRTASNAKGHGTHSPFVYDFIRHVLIDKKQYSAYIQVEQLRKRLQKDKRIINIEDFGAGSRSNPSNQRKVADICKRAAKPAKYDQLFFRMLKHYQCQYILELGTSFGITTSYLALANPDANIITCEESKSIADIAQQNFSSLSIKNITQILGNFDNTLQDTLNKIPQIDFVYIDGNHRKEPTLQYWQMLLTKAHNETLFIFDDIHWGREMEDAWKTIQQSPFVTCSIDMFFIGIICIRKGIKEPIHLTIRY